MSGKDKETPFPLPASFRNESPLVHFSVLTPVDCNVSILMNRIWAHGGEYVMSGQLITQESKLVSGNGQPRAFIQNIHTFRIPKKSLEDWLAKPYDENELHGSGFFFAK